MLWNPFFLFLVGLEFELRVLCLKSTIYCSSHTSSPFCSGNILEMRVSWSICLGWSQTTILPILASQVARIIGMNHQCLAEIQIFLSPNIMFKKSQIIWVLGCTPVIPTLRRLKAGGLWVQGQPRIHSNTLSQKNKTSSWGTIGSHLQSLLLRRDQEDCGSKPDPSK
jgi:hypothetical protein